METPAETHEARDLRPRLRGVFHGLGAAGAAVATVPFVAHARPGIATTAAAVFGCSVVVCFGTSAVYHLVDWGSPWNLRMKRADHIGIFVLAAGTYTGVAAVLLDGWFRTTVLVLAWGSVFYGVVAASLGLFERRGAANASYITLGWLAVLMLPSIVDDLAAVEIVALVAGGVVYTGGAIALALRVPRLWPSTFGYHELWHVLTMVAAGCHASVVWSVTG